MTGGKGDWKLCGICDQLSFSYPSISQMIERSLNFLRILCLYPENPLIVTGQVLGMNKNLRIVILNMYSENWIPLIAGVNRRAQQSIF